MSYRYNHATGLRVGVYRGAQPLQMPTRVRILFQRYANILGQYAQLHRLYYEEWF